MLATIQSDMLQHATEFREADTFEPKTYGEFKAIVESSFARAWWCGERQCEAEIKEETKVMCRMSLTAGTIYQF